MSDNRALKNAILFSLSVAGPMWKPEKEVLDE